jgi:quinol monooxygenase YgiN
MVRLTVVIRAPLRKTREVIEALRSLMVPTRLQPGCLGCYEWVDLDSVVHYEEEWATEPDMRRRVRSDSFTSLLAVLESTTEPPRVQFDFVAMTRGLDYVEEARGVAS